MSSEREILIKLNDLLSSIANTLFAIGSTRMLILDRASLADASLVYFRENGEERFRVGMSCGEKDFTIQYSPNGSPLTYDDRLRIDSETGKVTVKGLSLDGADFANIRLTGQTRFADGSAAAPAIAFSDNMDSGMFAPAANSLGLSCAGEVAAQFEPGRMRLSGRITAEADDFRLEALTAPGSDTRRMSLVSGGSFTTSRGAYMFVCGNDHASTPGRAVMAAGVGAGAEISATTVSLISIGSTVFSNGGTEAARMTQTGLGIGTSAVGAAVDIAKGSSSTVRLRSANAAHGYQIRANVSDEVDYGFVIEDLSSKDLYWVQGGASGFHRWFIDGSEKMRLNSAGQLAVGVTDPLHSVDAAGNIRARGDFLVGLSTGTYLGDDNAIRPALSSAYLNLKGGAGRAKVSLANDFISLVAGNSGGNISFSTGATSSTDPGVEIDRFSAAGQFLIGTTSGVSKLVVNDDSLQLTTPKTPASATDTGETGQIAWDEEHIYVCTAPDTWKRSALTTW